MNFAGKWVEIEQIMFSEESQIKKNKCHMIPLIRDLYFKIFRDEYRAVNNFRDQEGEKELLPGYRVGKSRVQVVCQLGKWEKGRVGSS